MSNSDTAAQIDQVVSLARQILSGEIDLIEGCRSIDDLRWDLDRDGRRDVYYPFVEFTSRLPMLPRPGAEHLFEPSHLERVQAIADEVASTHREALLEACRVLLRSYGHAA